MPFLREGIGAATSDMTHVMPSLHVQSWALTLPVRLTATGL